MIPEVYTIEKRVYYLLFMEKFMVGLILESGLCTPGQI